MIALADNLGIAKGLGLPPDLLDGLAVAAPHLEVVSRAGHAVGVELGRRGLEHRGGELEVDILVQHRELEVGDSGEAARVHGGRAAAVAGLQPRQQREEERGGGQQLLQPGLVEVPRLPVNLGVAPQGGLVLINGFYMIIS